MLTLKIVSTKQIGAHLAYPKNLVTDKDMSSAYAYTARWSSTNTIGIAKHSLYSTTGH